MGVSPPLALGSPGGYFSHTGILLTQGSSDSYAGLYTAVLLTQQRSCTAWGVCELRAWVGNSCSLAGGELAGNSESQGQRGHQVFRQKTDLGSNAASSTSRLFYHSRQVVSDTPGK